jgi:TPR repeat protein
MPDARVQAVAHYRAASEARNAQAMFNLAWMHQYGVGMVRLTPHAQH